MAANGSIAFEVDGQARTLRFDINALCTLEEALGIDSIAELQTLLGSKLSFRNLRTMFACGLGPGTSVETAGDVISALGIAEAGELISQAINASFGESTGRAAGNAPAAKRKAGTG